MKVAFGSIASAALLATIFGCGVAAPGGTAGSGAGGSGGTGGTMEQSQGIVGVTLDGSFHEFHFRSGGVTPDGYTTFLADESDPGPSLSISFAGVTAGDYDCSAGSWTRIDYARSTMQASSATTGACVIHVDEVGEPGQPIRGVFDGTLTTSDGQTVTVSDGTFDVPNVIP